MKKILIALDYNPSAQKVAETGHNLAKAMHSQTTLLHVISDFNYYSSRDYSPVMGFEGFNNVMDIYSIDELRKAAERYLDNSKRHLNDESIQTMVKTGEFGENILSTAMEINAELIVLGTHSRRGLEKILVGSVAEYVLHNSLIPLFIIPTRGLARK